MIKGLKLIVSSNVRVNSFMTLTTFVLPEFKNFAKPKDWKKNLWELDTENPENNGLQNEDLIVWMRTAALPNFRKLYRKIDHQNNGEDFKNGIPEGIYSFDIEYSKSHPQYKQPIFVCILFNH